MELDEMKTVWNELNQKTAKQKDLTNQGIIDMTKVKYIKQANIFSMGEVVGLLIACAIVGAISYSFNELDTWYLRACAIFMIIYLLVMPLYSMAGVRKMKKIDLITSTYKEVLDQFYSGKKILKQAETVSFIVSPLLFVASLAILSKVLAGKDLFKSSLQPSTVVFILVVFIGVILFNSWAFKKRGKGLQSVKELLEEGK